MLFVHANVLEVQLAKIFFELITILRDCHFFLSHIVTPPPTYEKIAGVLGG